MDDLTDTDRLLITSHTDKQRYILSLNTKVQYYCFACDIIAAMMVYNNNRDVTTFFCCVHQHGRHTLCHLNLCGLSADQELYVLVYLAEF